MSKEEYSLISGEKDGCRLESRVLEEMIQDEVARGGRKLEINAFGQHGIGGRLWKAGSDTVNVRIKGQSGQRVGSMGFPNTVIEVMGPASDDVGWLNAGADIIVRGNATNGVANAMAQGKIFVGGNIGARAMTMTKFNPRFAPPELWVLGSVGDYFAEFMAGGVAVICGFDAQSPDNILGYRPFVGMVGGKVFVRGPYKGYSQPDVRLVPLNEKDKNWLKTGLEDFLEKINRPELFNELSDFEQWQLFVAKTPREKVARQKRSMESFSRDVWDRELGKGGMIGDLTDIDRSPIPVITTGDLRRFVPVWENRKYAAPCEASCPTGIPVQERWRLIREGRIDEAVDMALSYTPFPATVCGYLCPNLCMESCTRQSAFMVPVDVKKLGKASINASLPKMPPESGKKIAVIGGGPAGISVAWQLRQKGHRSIIYDSSKTLGGKIMSVIPSSRIPEEVITAEMERIKEVIPHIHLQQKLSRKEVEQLREEFDYLVIAVGAQRPGSINIPGKENTVAALKFLMDAKAGRVKPGKRVVIIGAGNVGCDVATEAHRFGAEDITLIDIQKPAAFGREKEDAEAVGAKFQWPCFTKKVSDKGVELADGEVLPADTVVLSIGDSPDIDFLPEDIETVNGFVQVDEKFQTSDPKIFAIGDVVKPGLLTDAIGAGRRTAMAINDLLEGKHPDIKIRNMISRDRMTYEYFDPRLEVFDDISQCSAQCLSCGTCRDCGICVEICPQSAISRKGLENGSFEYIVDETKCIGCGFCAGACPCGIWDLVQNFSMG